MSKKICPKTGENCEAEQHCEYCSAYLNPCNGCPKNMACGKSAGKPIQTKILNTGKRLTKPPIG